MTAVTVTAVTDGPARAGVLPARPPRPSARAVAAMARRALELELETYPKPGLVSEVDSGSHADMDAATFRRSARAIEPLFVELAEAGRSGRGMGRLRAVGLAAEVAMLAATGGVNTHRGAIFGLGLLCAAAGARTDSLVGRTASLGGIVRARWGADILAGPASPGSHGQAVRRRHGAGGARAEAAAGFPTLDAVALPALRQGRRFAPGDEEAARVQACFALMAVVEDTNLLHRGGAAGLAFVRDASADFLARGGVGRSGWRRAAEEVHRAVVARRLSPGGSADLLAMAVFVDMVDALDAREAPDGGMP